MARGAPTILWDFDGTLASRPGMWSGAMMQVLDTHEPGHNISIESVRPYLREGFPWHTPDVPHHHLSTAEAWWSYLESVLARAFRGVGFDEPRAATLARLAHECYIDPKGFVLYEDTIPTLRLLAGYGWKHFILSNNIPELPEIVEGLGLNVYVSHCITSARIGYEKPNLEAFKITLALAGNPEKVWMVGDEVMADVKGAEAVGLPAILVRKPRNQDMKYYAAGLREAALIIGKA